MNLFACRMCYSLLAWFSNLSLNHWIMQCSSSSLRTVSQLPHALWLLLYFCMKSIFCSFHFISEYAHKRAVPFFRRSWALCWWLQFMCELNRVRRLHLLLNAIHFSTFPQASILLFFWSKISRFFVCVCWLIIFFVVPLRHADFICSVKYHN